MTTKKELIKQIEDLHNMIKNKSDLETMSNINKYNIKQLEHYINELNGLIFEQNKPHQKQKKVKPSEKQERIDIKEKEGQQISTELLNDIIENALKESETSQIASSSSEMHKDEEKKIDKKYLDIFEKAYKNKQPPSQEEQNVLTKKWGKQKQEETIPVSTSQSLINDVIYELNKQTETGR